VCVVCGCGVWVCVVCVCVSIFMLYLFGMQSACVVLYCHLLPVWHNHIFLQYLINDTIFGKKNIIKHKMCVLMFYTTMFDKFVILRKPQRDIIINVNWSSCEIPITLVIF